MINGQGRAGRGRRPSVPSKRYTLRMAGKSQDAESRSSCVNVVLTQITSYAFCFYIMEAPKPLVLPQQLQGSIRTRCSIWLPPSLHPNQYLNFMRCPASPYISTINTWRARSCICLEATFLPPSNRSLFPAVLAERVLLRSPSPLQLSVSQVSTDLALAGNSDMGNLPPVVNMNKNTTRWVDTMGKVTRGGRCHKIGDGNLPPPPSPPPYLPHPVPGSQDRRNLSNMLSDLFTSRQLWINRQQTSIDGGVVLPPLLSFRVHRLVAAPH